MNDTSMVTMSTGPGKIGWLQMSCVEMLDNDDARVVAQRPVDLPVADVERDDPRRAASEKHVGESAGGRTDVERLSPVDTDVKCVERVGELHPAAADVRVIGCGEADVGVGIHLRARFRLGLSVDADLSGQDQRARPLARRREAAFDNQLIQTNAQCLQP